MTAQLAVLLLQQNAQMNKMLASVIEGNRALQCVLRSSKILIFSCITTDQP